MPSKLFCLLTFVSATSAVLLSGCSSPPTIAEIIDTNIEKVHTFYRIYMTRHSLQGPEDKEALLTYLRNDKFAKRFLQRSEIDPDHLEDFFVSQRDGKPFIIKYGLRGQKDFAIVFEAEGIDGIRMVALSTPKPCDDETYQGYLDGTIPLAEPGVPTEN